MPDMNAEQLRELHELAGHFLREMARLAKVLEQSENWRERESQMLSRQIEDLRGAISRAPGEVVGLLRRVPELRRAPNAPPAPPVPRDDDTSKIKLGDDGSELRAGPKLRGYAYQVAKAIAVLAVGGIASHWPPLERLLHQIGGGK